MLKLKERFKKEVLLRLRMEHIRHLLPNRICFYGHLISDNRNHPAWGAYRYPSSREFTEFIEKLRNIGYETVSLPEYFDAPPHKKIALMTFDDGYAAIRQESHAVMKSLNVPYAVFIHPPGNVPPNFPLQDKCSQSNLFMSEHDILDLKQDGVHIGFHGNSHKSLATTTDRETIALHASPPLQTTIMLSEPLTYAYPYSAPPNYQQHDQILMECGFRHIMDTRGFGSVGNHHFRVPLDIGHTSEGILNVCEYSLLNHVLSYKSRHDA